jgi:hypothetical protein
LNIAESASKSISFNNKLIVNKSKYSLLFFDFSFGEFKSLIQHSGFQDPATSVMEGMLNLHHDIMFFMVLILIFVG